MDVVGSRDDRINDRGRERSSDGDKKFSTGRNVSSGRVECGRLR